VIGFEFVRGGIERLRAHQPAHFGALALAVTALSVVLKEALAQYAFYVARRTHNLCAKADGWHHRSDALSSIVVLLGIGLGNGVWWMDGVLSLLVAALIFHAAYECARETVAKLLGERPSDELTAQITAEAHAVCPSEFALHHFHLHNYVSQIAQSHSIATTLENHVAEKFGIAATAHVEPL
jgi:cation diffusion facilitator family transporter